MSGFATKTTTTTGRLSFQRTIRIIEKNLVSIYLLSYIILIPKLVKSLPILEKLPKEAAKEMEGFVNYLPLSIQNLMSSNEGFTPAFLQSLMLILACELGDRTFFVAAILAMKSSRIIVWSGALLALTVMTILSAGIGKAFPLLLDKKYTSIAAALLFLFFGLQLLKDWWKMRKNDHTQENEELVEVEEELKQSNSNNNDDDDKKKNSSSNKLYRLKIFTLLTSLISPVFAKSFSMTALAEWGDRSQIATIALAASRDMNGVIIGGILGHSICTGLAVVGGRLLASSISERAVALMGGILFISFAFLTAGGVLE